MVLEPRNFHGNLIKAKQNLFELISLANGSSNLYSLFTAVNN